MAKGSRIFMGVLIAVLIIALGVFSYLTNKKADDLLLQVQTLQEELALSKSDLDDALGKLSELGPIVEAEEIIENDSYAEIEEVEEGGEVVDERSEETGQEEKAEEKSSEVSEKRSDEKPEGVKTEEKSVEQDDKAKR